MDNMHTAHIIIQSYIAIQYIIRCANGYVLRMWRNEVVLGTIGIRAKFCFERIMTRWGNEWKTIKGLYMLKSIDIQRTNSHSDVCISIVNAKYGMLFGFGIVIKLVFLYALCVELGYLCEFLTFLILRKCSMREWIAMQFLYAVRRFFSYIAILQYIRTSRIANDR